jgi:undecaprenyl-diphosphatase
LAFGSIRAVRQRDFRDWHFRFTTWILLATLPLVFFGVLMSKWLNACGSPLRTLPVIGVSCIVMAVLLAMAEKFCAHRRTLDNVSLKDAMLVGIAQVGALIPGVSRSGSTLTAALFLDLERDEAARFSFLLGLPAIFLAGAKELFELYKAQLSFDGWMILAVGLVVASISAFVAIWSLMRILEKFSSWPFVVYRFILGVVLLAGVGMGWLQ